MTPLLDLDGSDLAGLSPRDAVVLFSDLLWADALAQGVPASIDVPRNINAPDGGIDATVRTPLETRRFGTIRPGITMYQIKTTAGLNPSADYARKSILYAPDGTLRPRIRECLDEGGTLVIALFGTDTPAAAGSAEAAIRQDLGQADRAYKNAEVEVWRQDRLIGYLNRHPSLCRRLKGTSEVPFLDHHNWESTSRDMSLPFFAGPPQQRLIEQARAELRGAGGHAAVRIVGSPGSGKTRIAHEITKDPGLSPSALYFEGPDLLHSGNFLNRLLEDRDASAILVVDECDSEQWRSLAGRTAKTGGRIKLMTIHNKKDDDSCHVLEDLGMAEMRSIVESYKVPPGMVDDLARLCRPSPLYAHRLAEMAAGRLAGLEKRPLGEDAVHEHYIGSGLGPADRGRARRRKSVLLWFSLFARVCSEGDCSGEYEFLRRRCHAADGIAPFEFDEIVGELRDLKILQGRRHLYITPKMLHLWLWREWWRLHGRGGDIDDIVSPHTGRGHGGSMPGSLRRSFREMVEADHGSDAVAEAARRLLGRGGPFDDGAALEDGEGARTFQALARAEPGPALALLERTVRRWDDERLGRFGSGRRDVVWAVERMAPRSVDFARIAAVLLRLAANETEHGIQNSATGVLARLFVMAPGRLASTPAGADERIEFLARTLAHEDGRCRMLAIAACDSALESVRLAGVDDEKGGIPPGSLSWRPGDAEIGAYRRVVSLLRGMLGAADRRERRAAADVLLRRAPELSRFEDASGAAVGAIRAVLESGAADRAQVARVAESVLRVNGDLMGRAAATECRRIAVELAGGDDYRSRMRRYVGADAPDDMDASLDGRGGPARTGAAIRGLAAESLRNRRALLGQADWLFGPGARNSGLLGAELAAQDQGCSLLPDLLDAMAACGSELSDSLIGGYLEEVSRRDEDAWESALDLMEARPRLAPLVPAVTWRPEKMTDRSWARLARMHGRGLIAKGAFGMLARDGRACRLPDGAFAEALDMLLAEPSESDLEAALALLSRRCACRGPERPIPLDAARRVVLDKMFLRGPAAAGGSGSGGGRGRRLPAADWAAVAGRLVRSDPQGARGLADAMLAALGDAAGVFARPCDGALGALDAMAARMPGTVWERAAGLLAAPPDARTCRILEWACGRIRRSPSFPGAARSAPAPAPAALLDSVDTGSIWAWVDGDADARAACLARFVRPRMDPGRGSLARELLARYGGAKAVRDALHRNFLGAAWTGSGADHFAEVRRQCEGMLGSEADPNVRVWLGERIKIAREAGAKEAALEARVARNS